MLSRLLAIFLALCVAPAWAGDELLTVAERSGYKATARGDEVQALCQALADRSESVHLTELGRTVEDRPIPLLIVADPPVTTPEQVADSGKLVVLLVGNIHAGEVCGKEALPMLVRELTDEPGHPLLKNLILAVVPNFNADGNERVAKNNRPGQNGPEEGMGQRANAQGLDLNRDFIKLESPEARALVGFLNEWDPHVVVDTHTTNGSHHRYILTYQGPQNPAGDSQVLEFVHREMLPDVDRTFEERTGKNVYYYGNFEDNHTKWTGFPDQPRFGTNYVGLRGRIGILSEAYSYAPYADRVLATRDFVRAILDYSAAHREEIADLLARTRAYAIADAEHRKGPGIAVRSEARPRESRETILGFVEERREPGRRPVSTGEPKDYPDVEVVQRFESLAEVRRPFAYLIPSKYCEAVETLRRHGIEVERLTEPKDLLGVEFWKVDGVERAERPFEGHRLVRVDARFIEAPSEPTPVEAGTFVVRTGQPLGNLIVYLLEASDDGLHTWNLLDDGLEAGKPFPVLRLDPTTDLPTEPVADLHEEPAAKAEAEAAPVVDRKRIDFETHLGTTRPNLGGAPRSGRWLDDEHWLEVRDGRLMKVNARGDDAEPFHEPEKLAEALAKLPTIDDARAKALARLVPYRLDARPGGLRSPRGSGPLLDPERKAALFDLDADLYVAQLDGSEARRLTSTPGEEEFAEFSPDGRFVAFVRENDLHVVDVETGTERALTEGGSDLVRRGKADWVYFEEIFNRNWKAFWWSPDGSRLAFLEFDDRPINTHVVLNDAASPRIVEETPYPRAGEPNPHVRLGVVSAAGGPVVWADLSEYTPDSFLISGVGWLGPDSAYLYAQDRTQTWLDLVKVSPRDGATTRLFRDRTDAWIENAGDPHVLKDGDFLFASERTGWKHLYRYRADGSECTPLTSGDWEIRSVELVDEAGGHAYFTATKDNPIASNLYRVPLDGGEVERLTRAEGDHSVSVSPGGSLFLDTWSDPETPPKVALFETGGDRVRVVDENPVAALDEYELAPRKRLQIPTRDGGQVEAELFLPHEVEPGKSYPAWLMTYAGPHSPTINGGWSGGNLMAQALAGEGFFVLRMDPRSASGKGAASAHRAYKRLGVKELEDITDAVEWLKREHPEIDGERIGMAGHSYGGYITSYAMTHSKLFAAGIAGAPVTDWRDYDSIYTERFMLTPQQNPEGYKESSVVEAAAELHGRLLLLHGAIDDNVSLRNTMRLVYALQQADKDFELMIYPSARHGIFGPHYSRIQVDFIRRTLGGPKPRERAE